MDCTLCAQPTKPVVRRTAWLQILIIAAVFYVLVLGTLVLTGNPNLFPALVRPPTSRAG